MVKNKGISLIVLIVTIAVILILASTIIIFANNRPIESANKAKDMHNESVLLENAEVLSTQWGTKKLLDGIVSSRSEYVKEELRKQGFEENDIEELVIDNATGKVGKKGGALDVACNPEKYYGKEVDYKENSGSRVKWKIFYSDETNIYLITNDYIPYSTIPTNSKGNKPNEIEIGSNSDQYTDDVQFANILGDYFGSESITDRKIQSLNSSYFAYLNLINKQKISDSIKSVGYMLDTTAWRVFAGENAEYAIGGPTSELFIKSYNKKYPHSQLEYQVSDIKTIAGAKIEGFGYAYRNGSSGSWSNSVNSAFSTTDSLYVVTEKIKAQAMWLASPANSGMDGLSTVFYNGNLGPSHCRHNVGARF